MEAMIFVGQQVLMPTDKALVSVYIPQVTKEKLEVWAKEEERSVSYLVAKLIAEAIELREADQKKTSSRPSGSKKKK